MCDHRTFTSNSLLPIKISLLGILCCLITRVGNLQLKSAEMLAFARQKYLFLSEFLTISLYFPCYAANSIVAETASKKHGKVSQIPPRFACQNWFDHKFCPHVGELRGESSFRELCWGQMEDTEGFEPSKDREALASLAGRWFQPLTHVST